MTIRWFCILLLDSTTCYLRPCARYSQRTRRTTSFRSFVLVRLPTSASSSGRMSSLQRLYRERFSQLVTLSMFIAGRTNRQLVAISFHNERKSEWRAAHISNYHLDNDLTDLMLMQKKCCQVKRARCSEMKVRSYPWNHWTSGTARTTEIASTHLAGRTTTCVTIGLDNPVMRGRRKG